MSIIEKIDNYLDEGISRYFDPKVWKSRKVQRTDRTKKYAGTFSTKAIIDDVKERIAVLLAKRHGPGWYLKPIEQKELEKIYNDLVASGAKFSDKELKQLKNLFEL